MRYYVRISKVDDKGQGIASTLLKIPADLVDQQKGDQLRDMLGSRVAAVIMRLKEVQGE